jgi:hypothetical protein
MYGTAWMTWMEAQHPRLVKQMCRSKTFLAVARSVNDSAWEYRALLERQYRQHNPPCPAITYEENVKYITTMNFYVDSAVMRERVLVAVTEV